MFRLDLGDSEACLSQRGLAEGLESPPGQWRTSDIHDRPQEDVVPVRAGLPAKHVAVLPGQVRAPGGGEGDRRGQGGGLLTVAAGSASAGREISFANILRFSIMRDWPDAR